MKTKLLSLVAVFGIACGLSTNSFAGILEDIAGYVVKAAPDAICQTGVSPLRSTLSARNFCNTDLGASFAAVMCFDKDTDKFKAGQCGKAAIAKLGDRNAMTVLKDEVMKKGEALRGAFCKALAWGKKSGYITGKMDPLGLIPKICPEPAPAPGA